MDDVYHVIKVPDPVLKQTAQPIEVIDASVCAQADKMIATMHHARGIGLAANQVGLLNRMFVMDLPKDSWSYDGENDGVLTIKAEYRSGQKEGEDDETRNPFAMINPEVIWKDEQKSVYDEGCLSVPLQYAEIIRPCAVRVRYQDVQGDTHEDLFEGLAAHCVQHEIDHLNGVLFIDYLSSLKRNMMVRKVQKMTREEKTGAL